MAVKFNPFTGQLQIDEKGSGGGSSYIDGEVATYNDLPLDGTAALNSAWLVRGSSGVWPFTKPGGVYVRTATGGTSRDADYTYAGIFPDVFSDAQFTLYNDADSTKNAKFQLSGISTNTTRTLTVPNASGRIQVEGQPIGNTTPSTGAFTTLSASGAITAAAGTAGTPTTPATALGVQWSGLGGTDIASVYGTYAGAGKVGIGVGTSGILTEVASFALGGIALNRAVAANNGTLTASAPVLSLAQTWNNASVAFTGMQLNVTDTASNASSLLMQLQTGGTNRFTVNKSGVATGGGFSVSTGDFISNGFPVLRSGTTEMLCFTTNSSVNVAANGAYSIGWASGGPTGTAADVRMWRDAAATWALRDGTNAQEMRCYGTYTSSTNYQRMTIKSVKQTLSALSGASATTTGTFIPDGAVVVGVTTRVATALTGAAGYTIGDGTDADRWGDITGTAIGTTSDNRDWTAGTIECFTAGGEITLTAKTSNFTAGAIEICVFYLAGQSD